MPNRWRMPCSMGGRGATLVLGTLLRSMSVPVDVVSLKAGSLRAGSLRVGSLRVGSLRVGSL